MGDWNKQASRNNNIQPDLNFKRDALNDKKVQFNVQEEFGIEGIGQDEKDVKPHAGG
ncbi:hypothetical protein [Bacillus sp. FJAT-47783]|uniref:hypothetical protein n=1 Tax=Bacillus sp. FJAT-47783 TaxID=2922712 RepID=UPI001FADA923|nr:hypothetical protein [Bacillus sp. FJAT-47783]